MSNADKEKSQEKTNQDLNNSSDVEVNNKLDIDFTKGGVDNFRFYPDEPEDHRHKYNYTMKEPSKFYDPCELSRQASLNCILRNQDDRTACVEFFEAYRDCKRDFFQKRKNDRKEGKRGWGLW